MHRAETCRAKQERLNKPTIEPRARNPDKVGRGECDVFASTQPNDELARRKASELPKGAIRAGSPLFLWGTGDWGVISGGCSIRGAYRFSLVDLTLT